MGGLEMDSARALLISLILGILLGACTPYDNPDKPYVTDQRTTEPTFFSVQPVAYPHPVGCWRCGFPDRLGTPEQ
jgi:hypothetical protein